MLLSRDFELEEFACHSGEAVPDNLIPSLHKLVLEVLQPIRSAWANPLVVVSGWRSRAWNERVGGAKASTHITASGADIRPMRPRDTMILASMVEEMLVKGQLRGLGGLGKYASWIHVDTMKARDGHLRRWRGKGMGSELVVVDSEADTGPVTLG